MSSSTQVLLQFKSEQTKQDAGCANRSGKGNSASCGYDRVRDEGLRGFFLRL